jgi:hypothetical protein
MLAGNIRGEVTPEKRGYKTRCMRFIERIAWLFFHINSGFRTE